MLTFENRRMQQESRKKNKKLQRIRQDKENFPRQVTMEFHVPTKGHPLAEGPFRPGPILTAIDDPHGMLNPDIFGPDLTESDRNWLKQCNLINEAQARWPENADENMEIICTNGIIGSVSVRVFMSIRGMFTTLYHQTIQSLMLEHKDAMMKKEAEWMKKMENEKIELGKQISIRDQMVLEARAETNEYKSMNQSILSQISDKEAKIAQVNFPTLEQSINFGPKINFHVTMLITL